MNRGDRRELIFMDDADRRRFVETLAEVCAKTGWEVHAFVLTPNHFHLVVETPQPNLVAGMKDEMVAGHLHQPLQPPACACLRAALCMAQTGRTQTGRHKLFGHLFSGRYKSLIVDGSGAHERAAGAGALRRGAGADGRSAGRTDHRGGIAATAVVGSRAEGPGQGDARKVAVAVRLRRETTMKLKWISQHLKMGAWTHLNKRL